MCTLCHQFCLIHIINSADQNLQVLLLRWKQSPKINLFDLLTDYPNEGQCRGKVEELGHIHRAIRLLKVIFESLIRNKGSVMGWRKWQSGIRSEYLSLSVLHLQSVLHINHNLHVCIPVCLRQIFELMQQKSYLSCLLLCPNLTSVVQLFFPPFLLLANTLLCLVLACLHTPSPRTPHSRCQTALHLFLFHAVTSVLSCLPFRPACFASRYTINGFRETCTSI